MVVLHTGTALTCALKSCDTLQWPSFQGSDDGDNYLAFTNSAAPNPECLFRYTRSLKNWSATCVPFASWPGNGGAFAVLPYAGGQSPVLRAFTRAGHAWAATIVDVGTTDRSVGAVSVPADLGPGTVVLNTSFGGWPRHRGMAIVTPPPGPDPKITPQGAARLVRVPRSGPPQDVLLPTTPCADAAGCARLEPPANQTQVVGQVLWTESMGNDEYLVFYLSDLEPAINRTRMAISVARERATYRDVAPGPSFPDGVGGYPNAIEAGAVVKMCMRAVACAGGFGAYGGSDDILDCVRYWNVVPAQGRGTAQTEAAAHHTALLNFLAVPAGCSGLGPPSTEYVRHLCRGPCPGGRCVTDTNGGTGTCVFPATAADCNTCTAAGQAVTCAGTTVTSALDCAAVGQTCACSKDSAGKCASAPACVAEPCSAAQATCAGAVWNLCNYEQHDCGLASLSCSLDPAHASLNDYFPGCAASAIGGCAGNHWCDGKYLFACLENQPQFVDCTKVGFKTCGVVSGTSLQSCLP